MIRLPVKRWVRFVVFSSIMSPQSVLSRWPSWAPRSEYHGMERLRPFSPYLPQAGFPTLFRAVIGRVFVPIIEGAVPSLPSPAPPGKSEDGGDGGGWPVVVFSHGLVSFFCSFQLTC